MGWKGKYRLFSSRTIILKSAIFQPSEKLLLPPLRPCDINKKCLIIDLDETLVHSSFKVCFFVANISANLYICTTVLFQPVKNPDFVIPVEIDGVVHQVIAHFCGCLPPECAIFNGYIFPPTVLTLYVELRFLLWVEHGREFFASY